MKILIISNLYPSNEVIEDQTGNMLLHNYVKCWSKEHEVSVINPHSYNLITGRKLRKKRLKSEFELDGIRVHNVPVLRLPGDALQIKKFKKIVKGLGNFDFIIGSLPVGIEISNFVSRRLGIPYFTYLHNTDSHRSRVSKGGLSRKYARFLRDASGAMFVSQKLKTAFEKSVVSLPRGILLPGGLHKSWLGQTINRNFEGRLTLITSARLVKQKNIQSILQALSNFNAVEFSYVIAGDGDYKKELERLAHLQSNLRNRVSFKGMVNHNNLKALFDENNFMILLSTNESFGLVYIEAMARGCIPIGTTGEGIDGVITHGENGFLCRPDAESIERQLEEIVKIPSVRLNEISLQAQKTAKNFEFKKLADSFIEFAKANIELE